MKIPAPEKMTSGNWFIRMRLGGRNVNVTERTRADCIKSAQAIKAEFLASRKLPASRSVDRTVGELIDGYITKYSAVLSPSTVRGYDTIRRNRFADVMDRKPAEIRDWQEVISAELRRVSEKTVTNSWGLVSAALRDAKVPVPEVKLAPVPEKDLAFLEPEEIPPFLDAIRGDPCEVEILLELHGLRASEALQVVKENRIDLKRGVINVQGAIVRGRDGFAQKETNKTRAGTRPVTILIPRLAELAGEYAARKQPIPTHSPTMILKHVHAAAARAGVTDVTNHDLRRTMASLCYSKRISERVLMEMCGWDDLGTVHKIYVKLAASDRGAAVDALKEFYRTPTDDERLRSALQILADLREKYGDLEPLQPVLQAAEQIANAK